MWKSILDYPFKSGGAPLDASGTNNHGTPTAISFGFDGAAPGSGFFHFDGGEARVHVPYNETWNDLVGVRVEAVVRIDDIDPIKKRNIIVDASNSFAFWVGRMGFVGAACLGKKEAEPAEDGDIDAFVATEFDELDDVEWKRIHTFGSHAVEGAPRKIEPGQWAKLLFVHDGFSMKLYIDGILAAYRGGMKDPVFGVQSAGVMIGRRHTLPATLHAFKGDIDRLRIWKFDPYARHRRFFCRKMDVGDEACWRGLFKAIQRARQNKKTREAMEQVLICLEEAEQGFIQAVAAQGQGAMARSRAFAREYQSLLCANDIAGKRMQSFIGAWNAWVSTDLGQAYANYLAAVASCLPLIEQVMPDAASCLGKKDPDFRAFLGLLAGTCPPATEPVAYGGGSDNGPSYPSNDKPQEY